MSRDLYFWICFLLRLSLYFFSLPRPLANARQQRPFVSRDLGGESRRGVGERPRQSKLKLSLCTTLLFLRMSGVGVSVSVGVGDFDPM